MTGLWRQVLSALNQPDAGPGREQLLTLGAAELAHARRTGEEPVTAEDVQRIALTEFSLLLDDARPRSPRPAAQCRYVTRPGPAR